MLNSNPTCHTFKVLGQTDPDRANVHFSGRGRDAGPAEVDPNQEATSFIANQLSRTYRQVATILARDVGVDNTTTRLTMLKVLIHQSARRDTSAAMTPTTREITEPVTHR
jgi:hypothetical protein